MPHFLLGLAALCLLAACDSNEPSIPLDGTWARRDSVSFFGSPGTPVVRGTREDRYTFTTRGDQITGSHVTVDRDRQEAVLRRNEATVTGEILDDIRFTISEGVPPYVFTLTGTAAPNELRLYREETPQIPYVVLRRQ